jgi:hypothetical protein
MDIEQIWEEIVRRQDFAWRLPNCDFKWELYYEAHWLSTLIQKPKWMEFYESLT